jgi:hypothetical protein
MGISLQRHCADEAAQRHGRVLAGIVAHLHQEAPARIGTVTEINATLHLPTLGQKGAVLEHPVQLHCWREQTLGIESYGLRGVKK